VQTIAPLTICSNGSTNVLDLTQQEPLLAAGQENISFEYFTTLDDAQNGNNQIATPTNF